MSNGQMPGKNLLVINTGSIKKKIIFQELKKLGATVIVLNKEKNWAQASVDHWILADTYNHPEASEAIREWLSVNQGMPIDGAITFWEDDIPLLAKLCRELRVPGNTLDAALNTRDKHRMHEMLRRTGQATAIRQKLLRSWHDLDDAIKDIGFPAVIKPMFGSDSQFVVYVPNEKEARDTYNYVLKNCTPEYDPIYRYNKKRFLYQEYIEGQEFSIECYSQHGVPHVVGIHEKTAMDLPFFMETGDYIPPRISEEQEAELVMAAGAALIVLGVRDSLSHVEIKLTKQGPKIIEIASRMGGDYTRETIKQVYGVDLVKTAYEIALGVNVSSAPTKAKKCVMGKFFIPRNSGIITKISGFEEIKRHPQMIDFYLSKKVGDGVLVPPDGYENIGWVLVEGASYADVERVMAMIFERVTIEVAPFKSYSSFGRTQRKDRFSSALINKESLIRSAKIEHIKSMRTEELKSLHIGIACNIYDENASDIERDLMSVGKNIETTLLQRGFRVSFFDFNNIVEAMNQLEKGDVDMIFNVCERVNNSSLLEPHAASVLDILQLPYTGSNPSTLSLCIDKIRVKTLLNYHGIPTPKWDYAYALDDRIRDDLRYPLIVKPADTDNSIGITNESVVTTPDELARQLKKIITDLGSPALVEEYIEGDEYDVGIIGNDEDDLRVLPLTRSIFKDMPSGYWHIYPYDAKWSDDPAYKKIATQSPPKNINKRLESLITEIALDTYNILDCHDYGRVEIRVDEQDNPYVLELNPNPSINIGDFFPVSAQLIGMNYGDFIEEIIMLAIKRYKDKPPYSHLQTGLI